MHARTRTFALPIAAVAASAAVVAALTTALTAALPARPAMAQAMLETGNITSQSATTERPDWARGNESSPASRFVSGGHAGIADGSWFQSQGIAPGGYTGIAGSGGGALSGMRSRGGTGTPVEPPKPMRPRSKFPGRVAGLVYEAGNKHPVGGALVRLVSTDPTYAVERLDARTDSAGYYEFPRVEPGPWRLGLVQDAVPTAYVPPRVGRAVTVAKSDTLVAAPFVLRRAACVKGHAGWSDGYVLFDAPMTVAPEDTSLNSVSMLMNGVGDFRLCGAPEDSVMVWMHLRDGRSLGHTVRLSGGAEASLAFVPEPVDKMPGCTLRILPVLNDGTPVPHATMTLVGRRFEQADRPALVYVRDEQADADGVAEFRVPYGVYEIFVTNPRQGETGRVSRMVVDTDNGTPQALKVELRDPVSPAARAQMRADLLDRAETYLYVWTQ
jgi:hypothetical protein